MWWSGSSSRRGCPAWWRPRTCPTSSFSSYATSLGSTASCISARGGVPCRALRPRRELLAEPHRGDHPCRIRASGPGDVVGGAMVHAGTDDAEAHRDVHGVAERDELHRDGGLVVVHRDDGVVGAGPHEP